MPPGRIPFGELFCVQTNARKDGTLFKNMFYLKQVSLDGHQYIVGLQGQMDWEIASAIKSGSGGPAERKKLREFLEETQHVLARNMDAVELSLSKLYSYDASMRR